LEEESRPRRVEYGHAEADLLLETDLNHMPQRQKFSGAAEGRRRGAGYQSGPADAGISREAHRGRSISRFREHQKPGVQAAAAAEIEEGSDRFDDGSTESDQAADSDPRIQGDLRIRQGCVLEVLM
jgi:hypothetical protein